jgi:hypothetical protein
MTRALLGCTIVLALGLTARAQGFDPLYKPKPGDKAIIGYPMIYNEHPGVFQGGGIDRPKMSFFGTVGAEFPEMSWDTNKISGHMESGNTYLIKQGKRYHLHAGLKVKIIAKTKTVVTIFNAQLAQESVYEVEIIEGEFIGTHVYVMGLCLQGEAKYGKSDWDQSAEIMHTGLVLEDDNPELAIQQYKLAYSTSRDTRILIGARVKLVKAGVPLPPTFVEAAAKMVTDKYESQDIAPKAPGFGKPLATPKEDAPEALTVDLLDTTWEHSSSGGYIYIYVKVRNTSNTALHRLKVTASLEQQNNSIVSTDYSYLEPTIIESGGIAMAKLMITANPLIHHYNLTFEAKGREVKFKNRTR